MLKGQEDSSGADSLWGCCLWKDQVKALASAGVIGGDQDWCSNVLLSLWLVSIHHNGLEWRREHLKNWSLLMYRVRQI